MIYFSCWHTNLPVTGKLTHSFKKKFADKNKIRKQTQECRTFSLTQHWFFNHLPQAHDFHWFFSFSFSRINYIDIISFIKTPRNIVRLSHIRLTRPLPYSNGRLKLDYSINLIKPHVRPYVYLGNYFGPLYSLCIF